MFSYWEAFLCFFCVFTFENCCLWMILKLNILSWTQERRHKSYIIRYICWFCSKQTFCQALSSVKQCGRVPIAVTCRYDSESQVVTRRKEMTDIKSQPKDQEQLQIFFSFYFFIFFSTNLQLFCNFPWTWKNESDFCCALFVRMTLLLCFSAWLRKIKENV